MYGTWLWNIWNTMEHNLEHKKFGKILGRAAKILGRGSTRTHIPQQSCVIFIILTGVGGSPWRYTSGRYAGGRYAGREW